MKKLRTDIPLMEEHDLAAWIEDIITRLHKEDIHTIATTLDLALRDDNIEMLKNRWFKMCDKCNATYPFHTSKCSCGNDELRAFKQIWNPNDRR